MKKKDSKTITWIIIILLGIILFNACSIKEEQKKENTFRIISSTSTSTLDEEIKKYGKENRINIEIEHYGDLEIIDILNQK